MWILAQLSPTQSYPSHHHSTTLLLSLHYFDVVSIIEFTNSQPLCNLRGTQSTYQHYVNLPSNTSQPLTHGFSHPLPILNLCATLVTLNPCTTKLCHQPSINAQPNCVYQQNIFLSTSRVLLVHHQGLACSLLTFSIG